MKRFFTLEYWQDDGWLVGRLKENLADAYHMMLAEY